MKQKVNQFFNSLTPAELRYLGLVMMALTGLFNLLLTLVFAYGLIYALITVLIQSGFQPGNIVGVMIILYVYRQLWLDGYLLETTIEETLSKHNERSVDESTQNSGGQVGEVGN